MDRILDEEKEKVETSELLIDEIEKEFGDDMSKKDEKQSKKSQSRPSTSAKNVINDDEKSVKNNKIFEDNLDEKVNLEYILIRTYWSTFIFWHISDRRNRRVFLNQKQQTIQLRIKQH